MSEQDELDEMDEEQQVAAMGPAPEQEGMPAAEQAPMPGVAADMGPHQEELHTLTSEQQLAAMGLAAQDEAQEEQQTSAEALEPEQIAYMEAARQRNEEPLL